MKDFRVTLIVKKIKFEGVWDELAARLCFQRQLFKKIFETNAGFHVK